MPQSTSDVAAKSPTLYIMRGACSLASHIALIWAGSPYTIAQLTHDEVGGEHFLRINPQGAVPALVLADGTVITQSLAVLQYIADTNPRAQLGAAPDNPRDRAKLNEILADLVSDVHKAWGPVFAPQRYTTRVGNHDDAKQAAFANLDKQYKRMDALMSAREWLVFNRRTVADAYLYVMCSWKDKTPQPLADYPALTAFKSRLDQDPSVKRALSEEGLA